MDAYLESLVWKETEQEEEKTEDIDIENETSELDMVLEEPESAELVNESEEVPAESEEAANEAIKTVDVDNKELPSAQTVENIKVYNIPNEKSAPRIISGNIEIVKEVDGFTLIKYMKYGFGLVNGYTKDLK